MQKTDEFSFRLRISSIENAGIGLFALHDIAKDTFLDIKPKEKIGRQMTADEIPKELLIYCVSNEDGTYNCPPHFNRLELVWFLNHSDQPNAELRSDGYYSLRDIKKDDEIFIDYRKVYAPSEELEFQPK